MRRQKITQEQTALVLELQQEGLTYKEIAERLDLSDKTVSSICIKNGIRRRNVSDKDTLTCPKCKRGGFPKNYHFCPFCTADIRTERDKVLDLLKRTAELFSPPHATEKESKAYHAILRAIEYVEVRKDA
jgi:orotate phosphoribosyltransferase-like protein